jgi:hypothetical protein
MQRRLLGIISVDFDVTDQLVVIYSAFIKCSRKKWKYNGAVRYLFIDFKKTNDSVRTGVLCNILFEFGIPTRQARLIKMCLNETYNRVRLDKYLSDAFHINNGLKQEDAFFAIVFQLCFRA